MSLPPEEERFSSNARALAQKLCDEITVLRNQGYCQNIPSILLAVIPGIIAGFDKITLIDGFIKNGADYWENIRCHDMMFFMENADMIFASKLPVQNVSIFRELFSQKQGDGSPLVKPETIDLIWKNFEAMVKISLKYIHRERKPITHQDEHGELRVRYTRPDFFPEINIVELAGIWNIKLSP